MTALSLDRSNNSDRLFAFIERWAILLSIQQWIVQGEVEENYFYSCAIA